MLQLRVFEQVGLRRSPRLFEPVSLLFHFCLDDAIGVMAARLIQLLHLAEGRVQGRAHGQVADAILRIERPLHRGRLLELFRERRYRTLQFLQWSKGDLVAG